VVQANKTGFRFVLLMAGGIFAVFGSRSIHFSGAGPLGVLTLAFVAALRWRKEITPTVEACFSIHMIHILRVHHGIRILFSVLHLIYEMCFPDLSINLSNLSQNSDVIFVLLPVFNQSYDLCL